MKKNRIFSVFLFVLFFIVSNTSLAAQTYKVGEEIEFARNYQFDEPSVGKYTIEGAFNEEKTFGSSENGEYKDNIIVGAKFIPTRIGTYRINISIQATGKEGKNFSRNETIYFVVTDDGKDLTDEELENIIQDSTTSDNFVSQKMLQSEPYLTEINVENAKVVEKVVRGRTEYNLEIDKNASEIKFNLKADGKSKVEGVNIVDPNLQNINIFSVTNDEFSVSYTFKWETPEMDVFEFVDSEGMSNKLIYSYKPLSEYKGLTTQKVKIKEVEYTVLVDQSGNLLIPLKPQYSSANPDLYTFTPEGEILTKFGKFINVNGEIFIQNEFNKIFKEDLRLFNLEEVEISSLNQALGYKINRVGFENYFIVRLARPDGYEDWYQFNDKTLELIPLELPERLFETQLSEYFGIPLETDYSGFNYSYYDLALMAIAFVSLLVVIIFSYRDKK